MKSISKSTLASNHSFCLRKKSAASVQLVRRFGRSQVWHSHTSSTWNYFELKRVHHLADVSRVWESLEGQWLGLHSDGVNMGWCDLGLAQLASGIAYDPQWPEATRHELLCVASQLWDAELLQAMGGQLQLHGHFMEQPAEMDGLYELALVCKDSGQRHVHRLILTPLAVLRWLEDSRWQLADMTSARSTHLWDDLQCHGQWLIGQQALRLQLVRSLLPGDAVLVDGSSLAPPSSARWLFGTHIIRWTRNGDDTWTCKGLDTMESPLIQESLTNPSAAEDHPGEEKPIGRMDDIPVLLTFTAGQTSLAVRELLSLSVGQIVDLHCPASTRVTISTHGQVIGFGELIDIEGRLAVEIMSLSALP